MKKLITFKKDGVTQLVYIVENDFVHKSWYVSCKDSKVANTVKDFLNWDLDFGTNDRAQLLEDNERLKIFYGGALLDLVLGSSYEGASEFVKFLNLGLTCASGYLKEL